MRVQAIRKVDGFLLPMIDEFKKIKKDTIYLEIKVFKDDIGQFHEDSNSNEELAAVDSLNSLTGFVSSGEKGLEATKKIHNESRKMKVEDHPLFNMDPEGKDGGTIVASLRRGRYL